MLDAVPGSLPWDRLSARFDLTDAEAERLAAHDRALMEWSAHTNLVARNSLPDRAERHFVDSLQLWPLLPERAQNHLDFGSGAGFPGLTLAALAQDRVPARRITLVDSVGKKARFLKETAAAIGLTNTTVSDRRVEAFHVKRRTFDLITARAVAALPQLLEWAAPILAPGGVLIFPKGEKAEEELTAARQGWRFNLETRPSETHPKAVILIITDPERR